MARRPRFLCEKGKGTLALPYRRLRMNPSMSETILREYTMTPLPFSVRTHQLTTRRRTRSLASTYVQP
jgi:hypothetical protein